MATGTSGIATLSWLGRAAHCQTWLGIFSFQCGCKSQFTGNFVSSNTGGTDHIGSVASDLMGAACDAGGCQIRAISPGMDMVITRN